MHLFVTFPNNSGSTLMSRLLATSPNATHLKDNSDQEGHGLVQEFMPHPGDFPKTQPVRTFTEERDHFLNEDNYDWDKIMEIWSSHWDMTKPVKVEKSPPNVLKAQIIAKNVPESKFIIGMRDPHAFCVSMKSYHTEVDASALHWGRCAAAQIRNIEVLGDQALICTYEDLCENPKAATKQILSFVPELESLDYESLNICNANKPEQLDEEEIELIDKTLRPAQHVADYFGYKF